MLEISAENVVRQNTKSLLFRREKFMTRKKYMQFFNTRTLWQFRNYGRTLGSHWNFLIIDKKTLKDSFLLSQILINFLYKMRMQGEKLVGISSIHPTYLPGFQ